MKTITEKIILILRKETESLESPLIRNFEKEFGTSPFVALIGCLLSLQAKDTQTIKVCRALFSKAKTPEEILAVSQEELESIIKPIGLYKNKTKTLHNVSYVILKKYNGIVPYKEDELLSIKGVGQKTANLILGLVFKDPKICVDTHVHRISNRLGIVETKMVKETEKELEKKIPKQYWIEWNKLIVIWGQNVCTPRTPKCSRCTLFNLCKHGQTTKPIVQVSSQD